MTRLNEFFTLSLPASFAVEESATTSVDEDVPVVDETFGADSVLTEDCGREVFWTGAATLPSIAVEDSMAMKL